MSVLRSFSKFPWLSAILLSIAYATWGWTLTNTRTPTWIWVVNISLTLLLAEALASPWSVIRYLLVRWLGSDTRAFVSAIFASFLSVVILTWLNITTQVILLVTAGSLVRLDAQQARMKDWQAFLLLTFVSAIGLAAGWFARTHF
ncbi:MAG TPA: hypothetical protein IGS17_03905 [Oscillatoriales cyanobacterium M59_W2019_021]|nr:hypothetical protein [Oscillatoriales cyanobacterium M4454_W2019_049]HIK50060.1 hypothetical protein [Oscillatoriales cyanobacterium M59_W2019_021]